MENKIIFTRDTPEETLKHNKKGILNFQNLYSVYLFNNEPSYKEAISSPKNFIFPDGKVLSIFLKAKQIRGPTFTKSFLKNKLNKDGRHFFILPEAEDMKQLIKKYPKLKNSKAYAPEYIQGIVFSESEINKISEQIKQFKPNYVWVCIGNPKQEILSNQLFKKYPALYFNVGAAIDFILRKKKESPVIFRKMGLEWFYRLVTDFKHSKNKVWKSIVGLKYIKKVECQKTYLKT